MNNRLPYRPRGSWPPPPPPPHYRPAGISRQKAKKEKKEKKEKEREAIKAELRKEIEKELAERGVAPATAPGPKALTPAQDLRREELLAEKKEFPALFKAAKEKIAEKEEAEKEKMDLEKRYAAIVAELKPLGG